MCMRYTGDDMYWLGWSDYNDRRWLGLLVLGLACLDSLIGPVTETASGLC